MALTKITGEGVGAVDSLGIGTSSPSTLMHLKQTTGNAILRINSDSGERRIDFGDSTDDDGGRIKYDGSDNLQFYTNGSERMRLDSSGNALVGKTSSGGSNAGAELRSNGRVFGTSDGVEPLFLNRLTSDGTIATFRKDGAEVGSIGNSGANVYLANSATGLGVSNSSNMLYPINGDTGALRDNGIDLGRIDARFDDIFATNGTIQTSDQNEKQQIASLTSAEITAAKAISKLFKTFKWNNSVAEKGDAARTHTGVIAQEVQTAMTDAGLDAGDYAFFISSTWWETQTDVPAVEAVAEVLDDDGNVVTEAVEAVDAYTRTDTYETAEEAPDGAIERTRMGIRYPELLAFVGAATEQRLADIETRLTALENV